MGIFKKNKKSKEESLELTKTLVLNFNEVERIANYERKTSKKPAVITALIGIFAIMTGLLYPNINSLMSNHVNKNSSQNFRKTEKVSNVMTKVVCSRTSTSQNNSISEVYTTTLSFKDDKLISYDNLYNSVSIAPALTETPVSMVGLYNYMLPLTMNNIDGYVLTHTVKLDQTNPTIANGYDIKLSVDLGKLDKTKLTEQYTSNEFLNVTYNYGDSSFNIKQDLINKGYTCN